MKKILALILFIAAFTAHAQQPVNGLELGYGVKVLDTLATDAWYGPYPDVETALESVPEGVRKNRTIKIDTLEYWWRDGSADEDLVLKTSDSGADITFVNAITKAGDTVRLGGVMTDTTTIEGASPFPLNFGTLAKPIFKFRLATLLDLSIGSSAYGSLNFSDSGSDLISVGSFSISSSGTVFNFTIGGKLETLTGEANTNAGVYTRQLEARRTSNQLLLGGNSSTNRLIISAAPPATTDRTWTIADESGDRTFASREYVTTQLMDSITNAIDTLSSGGSTNATAIRGVTVDASASSPSDGDILVYRNDDSAWVLESKPTGGGIEIAQVMDSITNAIDTLVSLVQIDTMLDTLDYTGGGSPDWGDIGGTLSDQTDLQNELDGKADLSGDTFTGKVNFTKGAADAPFNIGPSAGDPSSLVRGDWWHNTTNNRLYYRSGSSETVAIMRASIDGLSGGGRIPFTVSNNGQHTTDANFTFASSTVNTPNISVSTGATLPASTTIGTVSDTEIAVLDGLTASTAELNTLDGITATVTELNYTDGVTSNIQTQLDGKQTITPTAATGTSVAFDTNRSYCTSASPCTGNITFTSSGAIVGQMATMIHNDSSAPTFGSEFIILSGEYVTSEDNYIMFFLRESGKVWVTISQEQ